MPDNIIFSDDEALGYVQQLENPNKVGWDKKNRVWRTPKQKGYDKNQIAYGLDTRKEHNPIVYNFLKENGRLSDPWLTDKEAKQLMAQTWNTKKAIVNKLIDKTGGNISQRGYNVLSGMAWHGHPAKMALNADSVTGKALMNAVASGDKDMDSVFDAYYKYGSNATQFADRIRSDKPFRNTIQEVRTKDGNKTLKFPVPEQKPFESIWKPEPPVKTIYPLNNTTPESISSWSGADAPNATPRLKDFQEVRQEDLNRGVDVYGDPVSPFSLRLRLPSITSLLQLNSPQKQAEQYFADALGVSDIMPEMPSLFPRFADGKSPIHIKPANRGKLTRLKKRTGKSASWFKAHGTPAQKKMAIFELNSRHWKH